MIKSVRIQTAHNGYIRVTWTKDGIETKTCTDMVSGAMCEDDDCSSELSIRELCTCCNVGQGCENAKWGGPAPSWFGRRGGKVKQSDDVDPMDTRCRK